MFTETFDKSKINIDHEAFSPVTVAQLGKPVLRVLYNGETVGEAIVTQEASETARIDFSFQNSIAPKDFVLKSLFKNALQELSPIFRQISVVTKDPDVINVLKSLSFVERPDGFVFNSDVERAKLLVRTKAELMQLTKSSQLVGRGFVTNVSSFGAEALALVCEEYNQIAWGVTGWARHSEVAADEMQVIADYVIGNALEIGAGSGRVTKKLAEKARSVVASDYLPEVADNLKRHLGEVENIKVVVEDILSPKLPNDSFECVCFWENGLGGILSASHRKLAVHNMCAKLVENGTLIIGVRTLSDKPCDHLMIATQNKKILGIYHCFSESELREMLPDFMDLVEVRIGDARPAGGHQLFLIARRRKVVI